MKNKNQHSLLIEIVLVTLFFALSTTVLLQIYLAAYEQSNRAALLTDVLAVAQNAADEVYLGLRGPGETALDHGCTLVVTQEQQGSLRQAAVSVLDEKGQVLITLPCSRYEGGQTP